jgi:hypothetical protein
MTKISTSLAWIILLCLGSACQGVIAPPEALSVTYVFSAETVYERIEIKDARLIYTTFADPTNRCAQSMGQAPCWTEADLMTQEATLSPGEKQRLRELLAQSDFWALAATYGGALPGQRFYPHHLAVRLGARQKAIIYQSYPAAPPMPTPFQQVVDQLYALVRAEF